MTCFIGSSSSRLGLPSCGLHTPAMLCPRPRGGCGIPARRLRLLPRVRALPDGDFFKIAAEAVESAWASQPHVNDIVSQSSNLLFSLADDTALTDAVSAAASSASEVASSAAPAVASGVDALTSSAPDPAAVTDAAAAASSNAGWFGFLADGFESVLQAIDGGLEALHVPYAYGFSIILLTVFVKAITFPLSQKQVQSSVAMQQLQPRVQELQAKYKNNPEKLQTETAALYQSSGVNPLAGCLPTLATLPVFIGLYRSLTQAADEGLLNEGWFFIPSLAGPTSIAARQAGSGTTWLFPFENGAPPIGWHDALAYLILPALLIVSQVISQKIISPPKSDDPTQKQMQGFLAFLPFMLGWFSLNVPSGLTLYWITNNILSTGQQVYLKRTTKAPEFKPLGTVVNPAVDLTDRVTGAQMGSRRAQIVDVEAKPVPETQQGSKFRARKALEAAQKAAKVAGTGASSSTSSAVPPVPNAAIVPSPELFAEITPLTENLEKNYEGDEAPDMIETGSVVKSANQVVPEGVGAVAVGASEGRKRTKKGKRGKKGKKRN